MKILFVASESHLHGIGGGATYSRDILSILESLDDTVVARVLLALPLKNYPPPLRKLWAIIKSCCSEFPSKTHYLIDSRSRCYFRKALFDEKPDLVVFNGADLLSLSFDLHSDIPYIYISHNIESDIIDNKIAASKLPTPVRTLMVADVAKTRRLEQRGARHAASVIAISQVDAQWIRSVSPDIEVMVMSGAFDYPPYDAPRRRADRPLNLVFLAKYSWWPNRHAAETFLELVAPKLAAGSVRVHFFGPGSEAFENRHPLVQTHGYVESLEEVWRIASFSICPTIEGSGINIKLAESLYNGTPVLATPHAVRGLPPIDDPGLVVAPLEDWPAFLESARAEDLARAELRKETRQLFAPPLAKKRLRNLIHHRPAAPMESVLETTGR